MSGARVTEQQLRQALAEELKAPELLQAPLEQNLIESGILSSLGLVLVAVALDRRFGVKVPDAMVTPAKFRSIASILEVLLDPAMGASSGVAPAGAVAGGGPVYRSLRRFLDRPWLALFGVLVIFLLLDRSVQSWGSKLYRGVMENGARLCSLSGVYCQEDFDFSVRHHALARDRDEPGEKWVVFGDSGTFGAYLRSDETISYHLEASLRSRGVERVSVYNFGMFVASWIRDFELMELMLDLNPRELTTVVITVGDRFFDRHVTESVLQKIRGAALNREYLDAFLQRLPESDRARFKEFQAILADYDQRIDGDLVRKQWSLLMIERYRPLIRYAIRELLLGPWIGSSELEFGRKSLLSDRPEEGKDLGDGLVTERYDERQAVLLGSVVDYLSSIGISTVLYVKPRAPIEWRPYFQTLPHRAIDVAREVCAKPGRKCEIVDLTWSIGFSDFSDSENHYTSDGSRKIAESIADQLLSRRKNGGEP